MVFYSDEKERVIPLLVNIMHYVVPYLRNHRWGVYMYIFLYVVEQCVFNNIQMITYTLYIILHILFYIIKTTYGFDNVI